MSVRSGNTSVTACTPPTTGSVSGSRQRTASRRRTRSIWSPGCSRHSCNLPPRCARPRVADPAEIQGSGRRVEALRGGRWVPADRQELRAGDVWRLLEPDGSPVQDPETGAERWRVLEVLGPDPETGEARFLSEPLPESEGERAARRDGAWWPGAEGRALGPLRLRGG